jgi:hypothetical protein
MSKIDNIMFVAVFLNGMAFGIAIMEIFRNVH